MRSPTTKPTSQWFSPDARTDLHYRSWVPARTRMILISLHGAGEHSGRFADLARVCGPRSIAVHALDLRGFGQSTGPRGHVDGFDDYLADLDGFIAHIRRQQPGRPVFLLGHSFGGTVAVRYGQTRRPQIQGAILSSPAFRLRLPVPWMVRAVFHAAARVSPACSLNMGTWARIGSCVPVVRPLVREHLADPPKDPLDTRCLSVRWLSEFLAEGRRALADAARFRLSVLSLCGLNDSLIDPASVHEFYRALDIADKQHVTYLHGRHELLSGPDRGDVYRHLVRWLLARRRTIAANP